MILDHTRPDVDQHALLGQELALLGSFELDPATGAMACSTVFRRLLRWSDDTIPSLAAFSDLIHPGDVPQFRSWALGLGTVSPAPVSCYLRIIRPDHDVRQVYLRAQARDVSDNKLKIFGILQDVSDAVADRDVLSESILLAGDVFRNATWGMFQTTKAGRYINANMALARIYGYRSTEEIRERLTNIGRQLYVDPGRRSEFIKLMKRDGRVSGFESQVHRRDGAIIWISESCREVRTSSGRFLYYEGTVDEITARKEAEEALVKAKETAQSQKLLFVAALENMSQGLCMFAPDGRLIVYNPRFLEIYGFPRDASVLGETLEDILSKSPVFQGDQVTSSRLMKEQLAMVSSRSSQIVTQELPDGRVVTITHEPMAGGGYIDTFTDVTEQRLAAARIAHMALHDPLTDLPNRVLFRERLEQALHRVPRGEACAVLCLDLDQFKSVNDTLGHPVGDVLLKLVTERLRRLVRPTDTVARLGGDEFAIVQSSVNHPQDATTLSTRLLRELSLPYEIGGHQVIIGTSIGIAIAPSDGMDPDHLLKSADMALYQAKSDGRGRYRYFEPEMDTEMQERRLLEIELRRALRDGELQLYYQPLVDLRENSITGFEALLRWNSPSRGMVSPARFVPLAEEIGLIIPMGEWVLHEACREATTWPDETKVAVNVSAAQFKGRDLVNAVKDALYASGLPASRLEIEITESVMVDDVEGAIRLLHELKELGIGIAMDDFGTGYSSLSYISRFPFDKIKIDQSFVRDLGTRPDCMAIIRAVTGLCDSLGVIANAEGVETEDQLNMLRAECCAEVQGYLISRPVPAAVVPNLLRDFARSGLPSHQPATARQIGKRKQSIAVLL